VTGVKPLSGDSPLQVMYFIFYYSNMNFCWDKPLLWFLDLLSMVTTLIAMQLTNFQEICNYLDAFYLQFLIMIIKYFDCCPRNSWFC
jgi:hypothetical protein